MSSSPDAAPRYPDVDRQPKFVELEQATIDIWQAEKTFERSVEQRSSDREFVFYDGPPFANGLPHYGHLITGDVKDAVPRYRTMRGYRVERRFGWDTHGLPVEMAAEKALGVTGRAAITAYGVDKFNAYCRSLVEDVADDWNTYVTRQARWVDMEHSYRTLDLSYMESVMWAVKQLHDKGLLYEGYRVLPYCWECETPLSNFETRLDDAYRDRQDPALTVWFELDDGRRLLVWTTTPWTLPSNLAIAVGADIDYAVFEEDGRQYVLGAATAGKYEKELASAQRVGTVKGSDLAGHTYTPLFPFFAGAPNAFHVLTADFVSTDDGTGAVHLAPGFGEDDQRACEAAGIDVVCPVDEHGRFTAEVPDYEGQQVFDANPNVIRDLKERGVVVRHDTFVHSYPHCWRTDTPLIYKAVSSWFVRVTAIKDQMVECNQHITWVPEHVRDGSFGKWLEGARDWSISRNRFWGSPIAVWKSDDPRYPRVDVYGSLDELERDFGVRPTDLHRPMIDSLTRPNPDDPTGQSTMRRVEDVLDCWLESGSMPFAQVHYPFENAEWFEDHFPADFICEYVGQVRGWFYTMHVLSTALFGRPAFKTCVAHGILLGNDRQKLSKRLANYPDPVEVFDTIGSDAMRWALLSSAALRGGDVVVERVAMEEAARHVLLPIWNAWHFLALYANAAELPRGNRVNAVASDANPLDRYVLAKLRQLARDVSVQMEAYDLSGACWSITLFLDALNNWYIRRSRDRFWAGEPEAVDVLHTVLGTLCQLAAPLLPLLTDTIYRGLTGEGSVHLSDWPTSDDLPVDPEGDGIVAVMDAVRDVCSAASSVRKANGLRNRLPLRSLTVASPLAPQLEPFMSIISDEAKVKEVRLSTDVDAAGTSVLQLVPAVLGPRVGGEVQQLLAAVRAGEWTADADGTVTVAGRRLEADEFTLRLVPRDEQASAALPGNTGIVVLDLDVTPELAEEGLVRDFVREVNRVRRDEGLRVSDRVRLLVYPAGHDDLADAIHRWSSTVSAETLATEVTVTDAPIADSPRVELSDGRALHVALQVVDV